MPFLIQYEDGGTQTFQVTPGPDTVEYPPKRHYNIQETPDGEPVIQRPVYDGRERKWMWHGYPARLTQFANLWATLETLEARARINSSLSPYVKVWENESTVGGFGETTDQLDPDLVGYSNLQWTTVKIVQATRELRQKAGLPVYERSELEFRIADASYDHF